MGGLTKVIRFMPLRRGPVGDCTSVESECERALQVVCLTLGGGDDSSVVANVRAITEARGSPRRVFLTGTATSIGRAAALDLAVKVGCLRGPTRAARGGWGLPYDDPG
jgi:hypothetical protein